MTIKPIKPLQVYEYLYGAKKINKSGNILYSNICTPVHGFGNLKFKKLKMIITRK